MQNTFTVNNIIIVVDDVYPLEDDDNNNNNDGFVVEAIFLLLLTTVLYCTIRTLLLLCMLFLSIHGPAASVNVLILSVFVEQRDLQGRVPEEGHLPLTLMVTTLRSSWHFVRWNLLEYWLTAHCILIK
jgi:hypothetical protein